ncbi:chaperonin 10-like protein [Phakopsora pachyrhizi]|nr:chaperonin 10-like protein [Phakopsora pachyrhizi]
MDCITNGKSSKENLKCLEDDDPDDVDFRVFESIKRSIYDPRLVVESDEFKILIDQDEIEGLQKTSNLACFYNDKKQIHMVKRPMPKLNPGQVLLHVRATGICGSDVHFWKHSRVGDSMVVRDECGAGHESAGEIIEIGEGVTGFKIGERVAIEAGIPCSKPTCEMCRTGSYNACPEIIFFSTPPFHGLLTRFHAHPACWLHKLPDNLTYEEGSLLEPLAVALAGIEKSGIRLGDPVLICGSGPIGLICLLACRAAGACPITITDLSEDRLKFAKSLVPSVKTIKIDPNSTERENSDRIRAEMKNCVARVALECTGFENSIKTAIYSVKFGGKVFVIGVGKDEQEFPFMHLSANEIDLQFQFRYANQYPKAIRLVSEGLIELKPLITHRFKLERAVEAFETAADLKSGSIKVQIIDL